MKNPILALAALLTLVSATAMAAPCEQIQAAIDAKIKSHGTKSYTLSAVAADQVKDQKVVGSCEGGAKKIVYTRS